MGRPTNEEFGGTYGRWLRDSIFDCLCRLLWTIALHKMLPLRGFFLESNKLIRLLFSSCLFAVCNKCQVSAHPQTSDKNISWKPKGTDWQSFLVWIHWQIQVTFHAGTAVPRQNSVQVSVGMSLPRSITGVPVSFYMYFYAKRCLCPSKCCCPGALMIMDKFEHPYFKFVNHNLFYLAFLCLILATAFEENFVHFASNGFTLIGK